MQEDLYVLPNPQTCRGQYVTTVPIRQSAERMDNMRYYTCCICGQTCIGYGNNPWPVNDDKDVECCDHCNMAVVIPARVRHLVENCDGPEQSKQR